ncbi:MAG: ABC transporter transmembrane domain-containing protein [Bacteroidota bacterium]|nr:ABC transporter transmembrane domain-containing protein [Bacteroidota bacterium]
MNKFFANKVALDSISYVNELFFTLYKIEIDTLDFKTLTTSKATVDLNTYIDYLIESGNTIHLAYFRNTIHEKKLKDMVIQSPYPIMFFSKPGNDTIPCIAHKNLYYIIQDKKAIPISNLNYYLDHILTFKDEETGKGEDQTIFITSFPNKSIFSDDSHTDAKDKKAPTPFERFIKLLASQKREISYIYIYAIFAGLISLSIPLGIQSVIGFVSSGQISTSVVVLITFMVVAILITGGLQVMQLYLTEHIQQRIFAQTAFEFSYRFPKIKMEAFHDAYPPELVNRFFDVITIQKGLAKLLIDFSTAILQIIFGLILLSLYHFSFIFFGIFLVVVLIIIIRSTGPNGLKTSLHESKYKYQLANWLQEIARAIHTFKGSGYSNMVMEKTDYMVSNYLHARKRHFKVLMSQYLSFVGFKTLITGGLLVLGCILLIAEEINLGQFVASEIIIILIMSAVEKILIKLDTVYDVLTSTTKIGQVTDLPLESTGKLKMEDLDAKHDFSLQVRNLKFKMFNSNSYVIENINFEVKSEEKVGISGLNEMEQKLFINTIMGIYRQYEGVIAFNHVSIRDISKRSLYHLITTNSQEKIFDGTILENLSLGRSNTSLQDVLWATKIARIMNLSYPIPMAFMHTLLVAVPGSPKVTARNSSWHGR